MLPGSYAVVWYHSLHRDFKFKIFNWNALGTCVKLRACIKISDVNNV